MRQGAPSAPPPRPAGAAAPGAGDGIVSTGGLVAGVAGATGTHQAPLTAALASPPSGSVPMAAGEHVSVSPRRDAETAALAGERRELRDRPGAGLRERAPPWGAPGA